MRDSEKMGGKDIENRHRESPGLSKKREIEKEREDGERENQGKSQRQVQGGQRLTNSHPLHRSFDQSRGGRAGPGHV